MDEPDKAIYFSNEIKEEIKPSTSKYYVCNFCNNSNLVYDTDIHDIDIETKVPKKELHMEVRKDIALTLKQLSVKFGSYEKALLFLINYYVKSKA